MSDAKVIQINKSTLDAYVEEQDLHLPVGYEYIACFIVNGTVVDYDIVSADEELLTDEDHDDLTAIFDDAWVGAESTTFPGFLTVYIF
jgi:hypothetical protein